jgi:hypothetical protein
MAITELRAGEKAFRTPGKGMDISTEEPSMQHA